YADGLVAFLAHDLRDGPRPLRTPENDPQISLVGPKLDTLKTFAPSGANFVGFAPGGRRIYFSIGDNDDTRLLDADVENPTAGVEITRIEHHLDSFTCATAARDTCLLVESRPNKPNVLSGDDPRSAFIVDRNAKTKRALQGEWGSAGWAATSPLAPDGS